MKTILSITCWVGIVCVLSGCSQKPTAALQPAQISNESFVASDTHELHFNAVRTDTLLPDTARAYGIERSKNKVLLNISMRSKNPDGTTSASDADIKLIARNLNGQLKDAPLRRIAEGTAIYYITEVPFSGAEILVFEISATPAGSSTPLTATLTREFFAD